MSFYGTSFSFDGVSCEEFGLMLYDLDSATQGASSWAKGTKIHEERLPTRYRSIFLGKTEDSPLEFKLVFGANEYAANAREPIDRYEMQAVAKWLTGPKDYRSLRIDQSDLEDIQFRCVITDLEMVETFGQKWGFTCTVHCDSPYAYTLPKTYTMEFSGLGSTLALYNPSTAPVVYRPKMTLRTSSDGPRSIGVGNMTNGTALAFDDLPVDTGAIVIDGEHGIMTAESGRNVYQHLRLKGENGSALAYNPFDFITLSPGVNRIYALTGAGSITFECEFPMNVGG